MWVPALRSKSFKLPANSSLILCFAFCGLRSTSFESPVNSTHSCVLDFVDYIGRASSCQPIRSCALDFVNYIGRVSSRQSTQLILCFRFCELRCTCFELPVNSFLCFGFCELHWTCFELSANSFLCVLTSADCIRVPSFHKFIPVCTGFSCLYFYAFYLGRQYILVGKIVFECVKFLDILFWYISTYVVLWMKF